MTETSLHSIIIGASGGIGAALAEQLARRGRIVHALSRGAADTRFAIDITDEATVATAAELLGNVLGGDTVREIIVATGFLHDDRQVPEKSWRHIDATQLAKSFAVNAIGPALVAKHFLPLLPRKDRAVFAALSARIGSIGDNRLGGWYGYRASKAALNQLIRTFAIELALTRPHAICVSLHPGTVVTKLSAPFRANVPDEQLFTPELSAAHLISAIDNLTVANSGTCLDWAGRRIVP